MSQIAEAYVQIIPTTKGLGNKIADEFSGVGGAAGTAMGGGLVATAAKFAAPIAAAFGAVQIGQFFADAVKGGSTLNESLNALSVSFGGASDEIAALGETAAKRLGVSNQEFNALSVRFSAFAKTIVGDGGDVAGLIDDLTTRGADFASVFDLEVADALTLFQSGLAGETEPLRRFGIDLSAAAVEAYAYSNGIGTVGKQLTEAEKIQARYGLLLQQTAMVEGDRANTANSFANAQRTLNAVLQDTSDRIGIALLPSLEQLLPQITATVEQFVASPEFNQFISDMGTNFSNLLLYLPTALENMQSFGKDALPAVNAFFPLLNESLNLMGSLFFGIEGTDPASSTNSFADAMVSLASGMNQAASAISAMGDAYNNLPSWVRTNLFEQVGTFTKWVSDPWGQKSSIWNSVFGNTAWRDYNGPASGFGTKGPSVNVKKPALAEGGTITRSGQVLVGEEGPEILALNRGASVIPLPRMSESDRPIYTDSGALFGMIRTVANGEARLVLNTADTRNAVMI